MIYRCCDQRRRNLVAATATLNGIDYLEVIDRALDEHDPLRQRTLLVHCLKPLPATFSAANVAIRGGERVRGIAIEWAALASPLPSPLDAPGEAKITQAVSALADAPNVLVVRTDISGDFSTYRLSIDPAGTVQPFDPRMDAIDFCFKVECPSDFDCAPRRACPPPANDPPEINYLAKDYAGFRRLLLDRMAQLVPQWQQSSVADTGVAVAELVAYAADRLSYQQDAIATEAYLGTARRRVSLRRHALLVDYPMHDGCNARTWVFIEAATATFVLPLVGTQFLTRLPGLPPGIPVNSSLLDAATTLRPEVYEPILQPRLAVVVDADKPPDYRQTLYAAHNQMSFYTWSDDRCCLAQGATHATLLGSFPDLLAGDVLLFEEVLGPVTGGPGDADPRHRHVVQLTSVPAVSTDPLTGDAITEIEWALADALPFPLCISSVTDDAHGGKHIGNVSVARGNLVLVDHGRTIGGESLGSVPHPFLFSVPDCNADRCDPSPRVAIPPRFRPRLASAPITQAAGDYITAFDGAPGTRAGPFASASQVGDWSMDDVVAQIVLDSTLESREARWQARRNLLNSAGAASDFVVEVDDDGGAQLRFGDDQHGERPDSGTTFTSTYRIGNGTPGNVGADCVVHIVGQPGDIANVVSLRNPLPATGGVDPETGDSVRRNAPQAFRTQERAVTTDDYAAVAERDVQVQRAAASLRWTGSWYTVFITADPRAGVDTAALKSDLAPLVDRYRMAGHDLEFNDPLYVSLEVELHVCVKPDYFMSDVRQALLLLFSNRPLPDGHLGLFHPDNFTFGQTVYLSPLYAAAHEVPGVSSVQVTKFQRQGTDDPRYLASGELALARLEIARLDNDPNFPEHGVLRLDLDGGK